MTAILLGAAVVGLFVLWRFWFFFRNPRRDIRSDDGLILSPADGFVVYARAVRPGEEIFSIKGRSVIRLDDLMHVDDERLRDKPGWLIGIYMSPFDVHYNRTPIRGHIRKLGHGFPRTGERNRTMFDGQANLTFGVLPFWTDCDYILTNERASYAIANEARTIYVTQIADRWVRKIVTLKDAVDVAQGEVFGLIRMGSQVDLFVPDERHELRLRVRERQHVKAGLTPVLEVAPSAVRQRDESRG
jgi:phosphatidylserine decarboxylase